MRAPQLLLALGLSIPHLAQVLAEHPFPANLLDPADPRAVERASAHKPPKHSKAHGDIWHLNGTPLPQGDLAGRDADTHDAGDNKPTSRHCNPLSPFCSDRLHHRASTEEHHQVDEKRDSDTPDNLESFSHVDEADGKKRKKKSFKPWAPISPCYSSHDKEKCRASAKEHHLVDEKRDFDTPEYFESRSSEQANSATDSDSDDEDLSQDLEDMAKSSWDCLLHPNGCMSYLTGNGGYLKREESGHSTEMPVYRLADLTKLGKDRKAISKRMCAETIDDCRRGSHCACYYNDRCKSEEVLSGRTLKRMRACLHAGWRNAPRDEIDSDHEGDKYTDVGPFATNVMSMSKTSPKVGVETGKVFGQGYTIVHSAVSETPKARVITGIVGGEEVSATVTDHSGYLSLLLGGNFKDKRDVQASPTPPSEQAPPLHEGERFTLTTYGIEMVGSLAKASPTVAVVTGDGFTFVESVIQTDPTVLAMSGVGLLQDMDTTVTVPTQPSFTHASHHIAKRHTTSDAGNEGGAITLSDEDVPVVMSAIPTDPAAVTISGEWDGVDMGSTVPDTDVIEALDELDMEAAEDEWSEFWNLLDGAFDGRLRIDPTPGLAVTKASDVHGSPGTVIYSVKSTSPYLEVDELFPSGGSVRYLGGATPFPTTTNTGESFLRKRGIFPTPTPGFATTKQFSVHGEPASAVISVAATSPLLVVAETVYFDESMYTRTQTFTPPNPTLHIKRQVSASTSSGTTLVDRFTTTEGSEASVADPFATTESSSATSLADPFAATESNELEDGASSAETVTAVLDGTNSDAYFKATDAEGRPIYVTKTGIYAASTETLMFSAPIETTDFVTETSTTTVTPETSTTRTSTITRTLGAPNETSEPATVTQWRTMTETRTVQRKPQCHKTPFKPYKTAMKLGDKIVSMTSALQKINGTEFDFPPVPQATIMPIIWKKEFAHGWEHLLKLGTHSVKDMFHGHGIDWNNIREMSFALRDDSGGLLPELSFQKALIMHLRAQRGECQTYAPLTSLNKNNLHAYLAKPTVALINGATHTINGSTTINGTAVTMHSLARFQEYDPRSYRVIPTPACVPGHNLFGGLGNFGNKDCSVEKCMWSHMKPLSIKTAFPAAMVEDGCCGRTVDYFTQETELNDPHWGTTASHGVYYPVAWASTTSWNTSKTCYGSKTKVAIPTCALQRQFPPDYNAHDPKNAGVHQDPHCSDMESCYDMCSKKHTGLDPRIFLPLVIGLPLLVGVPLLALLGCCLLPWLMHRHRRNRGDPQAGSEKSRRDGDPTVVNSVTGQAIDPATGQPLGGGGAGGGGSGGGGLGAGTALVAGAAAGAGAAKASEGGDGGKGGSSGNGGGAGSAGGAGGVNGGAGSGAGGAGSGAGGAGSGAGGSGADGGAGSGSGAGGPGGAGSSKVIGGDDGRGTLGRQAEEGRSRVHFDEPAAGEAHMDAKADGTIESASGREWGDVGSMRGRKKSRREGLNLGF